MSKELLVFSYTANNQQAFSFFNELGFTNKPTHKSLEFLCASDKPDEHANKILAEIIFIEESAPITDNLYKTLTEANDVYLIYTNTTKDAFKKIKHPQENT